MSEFQLCGNCPAQRCPGCPNQPTMRVGLAPVATPRVKKERPPLDRTKMGFGNHPWEYIDPKEIPTDFGPPDGVARRDFNNAFNRPHTETDVDIDVVSRPGAVIETNAVGFEGQWEVVRIPQYKEGRLWTFLKREDSDEVVRVPLVELGVIADRHTNLYHDGVVTKRVSGGKANKDTRAALTKQTDEVYT